MKITYTGTKSVPCVQITAVTSTGNLPSTNKVSFTPLPSAELSSLPVRLALIRPLSGCADVNKHVEAVIQSAKFPAAQPPDPNQPSKIETEYWPCPPSLAAMGNDTATQTSQNAVGSTPGCRVCRD